MQNVYLPGIIALLINRLPILLILFIGAIIAIVRWKKHPGVSALVCVIFAVDLLVVTPLNVLASLAPYYMMYANMPVRDYNWVVTAAGGAATFVSVVIWILALVAIFGWRSKPHNETPPQA